MVRGSRPRLHPQDIQRMLNTVSRVQRHLGIARRVNRSIRTPGGVAGAAAALGSSIALGRNGGFVTPARRVQRSRSMPQRKRKRTVAKGGKLTARGGRSKKKSVKTVRVKRKTIGTRLSKVERELKSDMSYKYVKNLQTVSNSCAVGKMTVKEVEGINSGTIRNSIAALPIGTGTDINGQTVAENTQISIRNCWSEVVVANTTDSACYVNIYAVKAKSNTATGPATAFTEANDDSGIGAAAAGQFPVTSYPTLFPDFKRLYTVVDSVRVYLRAGDQGKLSFSIPDFKWSDDYYDNHPFTYLVKKNMMFLVRLEGDLCFDSNSITRGSTMDSAIMCKTRTNFTIEYAGNVASRTYETNDSMDTFTGTATQVGPNVVDITS